MVHRAIYDPRFFRPAYEVELGGVFSVLLGGDFSVDCLNEFKIDGLVDVDC